MTALTEIEQIVTDFDWYAIDADGKIGHFTSGGQILPPSIAKSREILARLNNYFENLPNLDEGDYLICPDLASRNEKYLINNIYSYAQPSAVMSKKGLYAYDSPPIYNERPYLRVTIPKKELQLNDLPEELRYILEELKMNESSFYKDSLISEEITRKL